MADSPLFEERWLIAFTDVETSKHWLRKVLGLLPEPRHVYAFRGVPGGVLIVEHVLSRLTVGILAESEADHAARVTSEGGSIVEAVALPVHEGWTPRFGNCVTQTRALLGMGIRPQTARGLYLQLAGRKV